MNQIESAAEVFGEAFVSLTVWVLSWWTRGHDPGLTLLKAMLADVWPVVRWLAAAGLALGLVVGGATVMVRRRGAELAELLLGLGRFLVVLSAGWLILASAWRASESLADWILPGGVDTASYREDLTDALAAVEPVLALTMSVVGIGAGLAMVAAVLVRWIAAFLLTVGLPVLAAFSVARGSPWSRSAIGWLAAVLAFRPLAYLVCRVAGELQSGLGDPLVVIVAAVVTFLLISILLPVTAQFVGGRAR